MVNGISTKFDILPEEDVISSAFDVGLGGISTKFDEPLAPEATFEGVVESVGAAALAGATQIAQIPVSGLQIIENVTGLSLFGKEMDALLDETRDFWVGKIGKSKAEQLIGMAVQNIANIGTTAGVLALTGGAGLLLPVLAAGAGLETTAEALEEGAPRLNAFGAGAVSAATEFLTEKIPIGILQKPGLSFMKRLIGGAISDVPGELIATATEMKVINEQILGKDPIPTEQFIDILKDTAAVSIISTIGLSAGSQAIQSSIGKPPPATDGEVPDTGVSAPENIADALTELLPPPPSETIVPEEKQEVAPEKAIEREGSKSEYPELSGQEDVVSQDQTYDPTDNPPIQKDVPKQILYEKKPWDGLAVVKTAKKADAYSREQKGFNFGKIWRSFVRGFVDVRGNVKAALVKLGNDGKRVVMYTDAIAGAQAKAAALLDPIRRQLYGGVKKEHRQMLDVYLVTKRHQELRANKGAEFRLPEGWTEQDLQDVVDNIPPDLKEDFDKRLEVWSQRMGEVLNFMENENLLNDDQKTRLREQGRYYVPREILDIVDPTLQRTDKQGRKITVRDSGLKNLTEDGSDRLIEFDTEILLQQVYQRAITRAFRNRANLALLEIAQTQPDNGIVRVGKPKLTESTISALVEGERVDMAMQTELANEWVTSNPVINAQWSNLVSILSGTKLLKSMATTLNPEFAITNIPRDIAHIYLTTMQYASNVPQFALQMANDIRQVVSQAISPKEIIGIARREGIRKALSSVTLKNSDLYKRYVDNGGGTEFLTYQGRLTKGKGVWGALENIMGYAGEQSEILTRLALMNRATKNKKSDFEAASIARSYLDFNLGGSVSKAIDSGIPFFNASIQGSRGIFRAAKADPKLFGFKALNIGLMATSLYWANRFMYGDDLEDVSDNEQKNNWIVMTPFTFLDRNKEERRYYLRIPKDQGQRVFASVFEGMAKKSLGLPVDGDQIADAATDFIPVSAYELMPPTIEALMGYAVNKDFWRREDIWRGQDVLPQDEYNKYTPEVYVKAGQALGKSPVRMKYALEQVFTQGNVWTSLVGFGAEQVFSELTPEQRAELTKEMFERKPGVRRFLRSTRPDIQREKELKQQKLELASQKKRVNDQLDEIAERFFDGQTDRQEITEFIKRQDAPERSRLRSRFKAMRALKDVPNRRFWMGLKSLPPESRATNYWNQWVQLDELGRKELDRQSRKVPGFRSKRFLRSFNRQKRLGEV
jgi:hypothetical protein